MNTRVNTISPERPKRISLDFEELRAEGLRRLEEWAPFIWTDFNAHDPGITILETLCYAITDLAYRANLPIENLLTQGSEESDRKLFFDAGEILPCKPITANDYRKLLIDIPGVKNAWLQKDDKYSSDLINYRLNGLYDVKIDLFDPTIAIGSAEAKRIIDQVWKKLHTHRNLCEDFHSVTILETQNICICLDVEAQTEVDIDDLMAEIMFRLQEYLTPTIKSFSIQQLIKDGNCSSEAFDGPLLEHGFIPDSELEKGIVPSKIYLSDLYRLIMNIPGVLNINELVIKKYGEDAFVSDLQVLDLEGLKPYINLSCSCLYVTQDGFRNHLTEEELRDLIAFKEMENRDLSGTCSNQTSISNGIYLNDLDEFTSTQYEFPQNYAVGENGAPPHASDERLAQIKQLRAYLSFYDRLMANYLKQLKEVKNLLAVEQNPSEPTQFISALYDIPGIKELIFQPAKLTADSLNILKNKLEEDVFKLLEQSNLINEHFSSFVEWNLEFEKVLGTWWTNDADVRNNIVNAIKLPFEETDWTNFTDDTENQYLIKLQEIVESENQRFNRKNDLLNHLLARFGESFTTYSLKQFGISEQFSLYDNYEDFLKNKSEFLRSSDIYSMERALAYNYRKFSKESDNIRDSMASSHRIPVKPEVWNTDNVSGLKKKIYSLLNMGQAETRSVFTDPRYRVDLEEEDDKYIIYLVELDDNNRRKRILLTSTEEYKLSKAKAYQQELNEQINDSAYLSIETSDTEEKGFWVQFTYPISNTSQLTLISEQMNQTQARHFMDYIISLTNAENNTIEGFHLLEHILLRPLVNTDTLLQRTDDLDIASNEELNPYSFWMSLVLPGWTNRFSNINYRRYFEQLVLKEAPAHIAICFRWLEVEDITRMRQFEYAFEQWREAKANCTPDACDVSEQAKRLILILNEMPCKMHGQEGENNPICGCPNGNNYVIEYDQ